MSDSPSSLLRLPAVQGWPWRPLTAALLLSLITAWANLYLAWPQTAVLALALVCILLWASNWVAEYWPALLLFCSASILQLAPPTVVFAGFFSSPFWLLFSGMVLGAAVRHTGLGQRAGRLLSRLVGHSYTGLLTSLVGVGMLLAFLIPSSMGRLMLLIPLVLVLAEQLGYSPHSQGHLGMVLATALGTCLPAYSILPANAPNMLLAGLAEHLYQQPLGYWQYLLLHFPVLGLLKGVLIIGVVRWLYPAPSPTRQPAADISVHPWQPQELRLLALLLLCLVLWLSDSWHRLAPGWVALAAALYCLWPGTGLVSKQCLNTEINYASLFFVAGIMSLGALIEHSGLGQLLITQLLPGLNLATGQELSNLLKITGLATLVGLLTNLPGIPAVMTPMAEQLAQTSGLSLVTVLMSQVLAFANVLLPYQAPPLVSAMQLAQYPLGPMSRACLWLFFLSLALLLPLDMLWWYGLELL
ncbi:SLC13 family permease [Balneatrix alpica]|uniref:SLC13 family permease n=1 Tax=Balneatrix alpica TaxID=75684 RepID=A0ABV5ZBQ5_9GAMM|nr:SLC13 family permease [Balneatrix alpica]